jgi:glycosyltransferase involved in cell wall biosynthesis
MKSIQVIPSIADEASGPTYTVTRLTQELSRLGVDSQICSLSPGPDSALSRTFPANLGPTQLGFSSALRRHLYHQGKLEREMVFHCHGIWMMPVIYGAWAAKRSGKPLFWSPRGMLAEWALKSGSKFKPIFWKLLQKPALEKTSVFHATAECEVEDVRRSGFRQPIALIPNGIDIPPPHRKRTGQTFTLLYLGRIHPKKGIDNLLLAWKRLQDSFPQWQVKIVGGEGDNPTSGRGYLASLQTLTREAGISRVAFPGPLYGQAKQTAYAEADLYILPTHSENFGVSVAEALAAGTPAIVTHGAPWQGLDTHGAGLWVPNSIDSIAIAMENMMRRSREELAAMGQNGRRWMAESFGWRPIAEQMQTAYQWALDPTRPKPECIVD